MKRARPAGGHTGGHREGASAARYEVVVCLGPTCGGQRDARAVYDEVRALVSSFEVEDRVDIGWQCCFGRCSRGPVALVRERVPSAEPLFVHAPVPAREGGRAAMYYGVRPADADQLIRDRVFGGAAVHRLAGGSNRRSSSSSEQPAAPRARAGGPGSDGEE